MLEIAFSNAYSKPAIQCIQTPQPNLVEGMKWLQSTFANKFNRLRKANGHVFQGRYKAILLDAEAIAAVCHYIHLNPVRAGIVQPADLHSYLDRRLRKLSSMISRMTI